MLHAELYMGRWGRAAVAVIGAALLGQAVTGAVLWWPHRRRPVLGLAVRRGPWRLKAGDAHPAIGVLSLAFTAPVALTGAILGLVAAVAPGSDASTGADQGRERARGQSAVTSLRHALTQGSVDAVARVAETALPGGQVAVLSADPVWPDRTTVRLRLPSQVDPRAHGVVVVDARRQEPVEVRPAHPAPLGSRLWALVVLLHYGDFGGTASRLVYAAGAVMSLALVATGIAAWFAPPPRDSAG
jgi:uncharacterized iron-regulated membrane protein